MSTHFTYEIDERKLRVKLKDLETHEGATEAWQRFEAHMGSQARQYTAGGLKNLQVPLNRQMIVPVVFGGLIIFFSFLLFNFINIKSRDKESAKTQEIPVNLQPQPEMKQNPDPIPVSSAQQKLPESNNEAVKAPETIITKAPQIVSNSLSLSQTGTTNSQAQQAGGVAVNKTVSANTVPEAKISPAVAGTVAVQPTTLVPQGQGDLGLKKKRKKRSVDVVEGDSASDTRQDPGSEEREAEIARPN